jgi:pimeloyl-ACP methyl ester carboxylesterase
VSTKFQRIVYAASAVVALAFSAQFVQFAHPAVANAASAEPASCVAGSPADAKCGLLSVPENRYNPGTRVVKVPYEVIPAAKKDSKATPVVIMPGGLGQSLSSLAESVSGYGFGDDRDIVLIGQRGGKGAEPSLDCPDASDDLFGTFATTDAVAGEGTDTGLAMADCLADFVSKGGDPSGYTILQSAADVIDLRYTLGYPSWTVVGSGWAAKVMAAAASYDPQGTASLILDSFDRTDADVKANSYEAVTEALADLSARKGSPSKDLGAELMKAAVAFDDDPVSGPVTNPFSGREGFYEIGGSDLYTLVQQALADPSLAATVPALLGRIADGDLGAVQSFMPFGSQALGSVNWGQYFVSTCLDSQPYWSADPSAPEPAAGAESADDPVDPPRLTYLSVTDTVCKQLALPAAPGDLRVPPAFAQPALLLSSPSDPFVPAGASAAVAGSLPNVRLLTFAGTGGTVLGSSDCARTTVGAWLTDPTKDVSALCAHDEAVVPIVSADSVHLTSRYGSVATAAQNANWVELLVPILFLGFSALWFVIWIITVAVRAIQREPIRLLIASGITPVSGLAFIGIGVAALSAAGTAEPGQALLGVPHVIPWLGILLAAGFLALIIVWKLGSRGAALLATAAVPFWLAMAGWFVWIFVLPS